MVTIFVPLILSKTKRSVKDNYLNTAKSLKTNQLWISKSSSQNIKNVIKWKCNEMPQTEPVWNNNIITSNMQNHGQCYQYSILLVQSRLVNTIQEGRQPRVIGWRMKKSPMKLVIRTTLNLSLQAKISLIYINHHEVPRWRLTYES